MTETPSKRARDHIRSELPGTSARQRQYLTHHMLWWVKAAGGTLSLGVALRLVLMEWDW